MLQVPWYCTCPVLKALRLSFINKGDASSTPKGTLYINRELYFGISLQKHCASFSFRYCAEHIFVHFFSYKLWSVISRRTKNKISFAGSKESPRQENHMSPRASRFLDEYNSYPFSVVGVQLSLKRSCSWPTKDRIMICRSTLPPPAHNTIPSSPVVVDLLVWVST